MQINQQSKLLIAEIKEKYGEIIGGYDLAKLLGYKSTASLRQAISRNQIPFTTFNIENRKGKFAYTNDVINWLTNLESSRSL
ncbi:hypothetical protein [Acinetobacter wuhouensis]|uniref:DNA-binding protein n=1 Tax=Acinetobacter wuhouensis TaxID=1879050 RepID=A0A4Q7AE80_9GAMM|nr:hypothetical protein [Acinetobacter wuhouensis]RZG43273.1 hypothetical protein EXU28_17700 [Acinetobacter wuhouensis]